MADPAAAAPPESRPVRRAPLQARSRETRRRLLEAAIDTLIASGHARTTTTAVCRRAGVSQGALFRHFPSKRELLVATVGHLFERLIADFETSFAALPDEPDRVASALRLLRESFAQPRLLAALELYTAARTDAALRGELAPVMERHRENLRRAAARLFPGAGRVEEVADAVVAAVQGAALGALVLPEPEAEARSFAWLEQVARQEIEGV